MGEETTLGLGPFRTFIWAIPSTCAMRLGVPSTVVPSNCTPFISETFVPEATTSPV